MAEDLHIILHKCRGEPVFEIAIRWDFGTPSDPAPWWILQSTGNRVYPFWTKPFEAPSGAMMPPEARDFYAPREAVVTKARATQRQKPSIDDVL